MPSSPSISIPKEWPQEVIDQYDPVRILGKGGFASVTLARRKSDEEFVAMKIAGFSSNSEDRAYAHREILIVRELNHPNIMRVLQSWEPKKRPAVLALQYYKGPTAEALIRHGGSFSTLFSRVVIAQLTDAISYLHTHAVVHRDIKPDNVVVTGAFSKDNTIWDNVDELATQEKQDGPEYWAKMREKWKVTLVDFGFARALTSKDVAKPSLEIRKENLDASFHRIKIDLSERPRKLGTSSIEDSLHSVQSIDSGKSDGSVKASGKMRRVMSALGNRMFVAPEILNKMYNEKHDDPVEITDTIGKAVSEYGLMVDAYSFGCTIRYMMTGCMPNIRVKSAIAEQNSFLNKLFDCCSSKGERKVQFRTEEELPKEAQKLIESFTEKAERNRLSVRTALRKYPWISEVLPCNKESYRKIRYLKIVAESRTEK